MKLRSSHVRLIVNVNLDMTLECQLRNPIFQVFQLGESCSFSRFMENVSLDKMYPWFIFYLSTPEDASNINREKQGFWNKRAGHLA